MSFGALQIVLTDDWHGSFCFFARFEYALKRTTRYLSSKAEANWDRFAEDHNHSFDLKRSSSLTAAVEYFKSRPPAKQWQEDGKLGWKAQASYTSEPLLPWLLMAVRRARNNLFHGGKFPGQPIAEPSRDSELIANATVILDACLMLDGDVRAIFVEGIED